VQSRFTYISDGMALRAVTVYGLNCCIDSERGIMSFGETDASTHNAIESYSQYGTVIFLIEWYFQLLDELQ